MIHSLTHSLVLFPPPARIYAELVGGLFGWLGAVRCFVLFLLLLFPFHFPFLFLFPFLLFNSPLLGGRPPPPPPGWVAGGEVGSKLLCFEDGLQSIRTGYEVAGCVCVCICRIGLVEGWMGCCVAFAAFWRCGVFCCWCCARWMLRGRYGEGIGGDG